MAENIEFQWPLREACAAELEAHCSGVPHGRGRVIRQARGLGPGGAGQGPQARGRGPGAVAAAGAGWQHLAAAPCLTVLY